VVVTAEDLRDAETTAADAVNNLLKPDPTSNVRALVALEVKRIDDLRAAESRRVDSEAALRAFYDEKLRDAESKRIDAIRSVDVNAVAVANERANAQAAVLASQVQASAEALRALVASTSATVAQQFNQVTAQIQERLAALEKSSYEGQGRSAYTDPALTALLAEVRTLSAARAQSSGTSQGANAVVGYIFAGLGGIAVIVSFVVVLTR
jgi:hypothetical protein